MKSWRALISQLPMAPNRLGRGLVKAVWTKAVWRVGEDGAVSRDCREAPSRVSVSRVDENGRVEVEEGKSGSFMARRAGKNQGDTDIFATRRAKSQCADRCERGGYILWYGACAGFGVSGVGGPIGKVA